MCVWVWLLKKVKAVLQVRSTMGDAVWRVVFPLYRVGGRRQTSPPPVKTNVAITHQQSHINSDMQPPPPTHTHTHTVHTVHTA